MKLILLCSITISFYSNQFFIISIFSVYFLNAATLPQILVNILKYAQRKLNSVLHGELLYPILLEQRTIGQFQTVLDLSVINNEKTGAKECFENHISGTKVY